MLTNLLFLWTTFSFSWKAWLAFTSFLLGLWFAWLEWASWARRLRRATVDGLDLSNNIATLRHQLKEVQATHPMIAAEQTNAEVAAAMVTLDKEQPALRGQDDEPSSRPLAVFPIPKQRPEATSLSSDLNRRLPREFEGEDVRFDHKLGVLYNGCPAVVDDFTLFEGIDDYVQEKLNQLGIYQYRQVCCMSDENLVNLESRDPAFAKVHWEFWRHRLRAKGGRCGASALAAGEKTRRILEQKTAEKLAQQREAQSIPVVAKPVPLSRSQTRRDGSAFDLFEPTIPVSIAKTKVEVPDVTFEPPPLPSCFAGEDMKHSPKFGWVYRTTPNVSDDFLKLADLPSTANSLLHGIGIHRYRQLAFLEDQEIAALETHDSGLNGPDWPAWRAYFRDHETVPDPPETLPGDNLTLSPTLGMVFPRRPAVTDDFTRLRGVNVASARRLNELGIFRYQQLAHWTEVEIDHLLDCDARFQGVDWAYWSRHFKRTQGTLAIPSAFDGQSVQWCPRLGVVYPQAPPDPDDLTVLQGVDVTLAEALNRLGIYKFKQVASWTDGQVTALHEHGSSFKRVPWRQWRRLLNSQQGKLTIPAAFAGEPVHLSPTHGVVYAVAPKIPDQLDLMDGLSEVGERCLHKLGIYRFQQIANLTDAQITALRQMSPEFRKVGWNLWRAHLKVQGEGRSLALARLRRGVPMEFALHDHTVMDSQLGVLYRRAPQDPDPLTRLSGIDATMEAALNTLGIHTFRQLAFMNDQHFANLRQLAPSLQDLATVVTRWKVASLQGLEFRAAGCRSLGDLWRWDAWHSANRELLVPHERFGAVFESAPPVVDQLAALDGIDEATSQLLHDLGIFQFAQLMQMTPIQFEALRQHDTRFRELNRLRIRQQASRLLGQHPAPIRGRDRWRATHHGLGTGVEVSRS